MGDFSGTVYTANDIGSLSQDTTVVVADQRGSVPENYPADYMYYPLQGKDNNPLIAKVGNENYSAWMKRSGVGEPFSEIVLLTRQQADNIYALRPEAKPDVDGGQAKSFVNTGKPVYVNPNIRVGGKQSEIDASMVSMVHYNVQSGEIVGANTAINVTSPNRRSSRRGDVNATTTTYGKALLPNELTKDGNVSTSDLSHELKGYQLISQIVVNQSQDSKNKAVAESFLIGEIKEGSKYIIAANSGVYTPDLVVANSSVISNVSNINFDNVVKYNIDPTLKAPDIDMKKSMEDYYAGAIKRAGELKAQQDAIRKEKVPESAKPEVGDKKPSGASIERKANSSDVIKGASSEMDEAVKARISAVTPDVVKAAIDKRISKMPDGFKLSDAQKKEMVDGAYAEIKADMKKQNVNLDGNKAAQEMINDIPNQIEKKIEGMIKGYNPETQVNEVFNANAQMQGQLNEIMQNQMDQYKKTMPAEEYAKACETVEKDYPEVKCLPQP